MTRRTLYDLLGVSPAAKPAEIEAAFETQCIRHELAARRLRKEDADVRLKALKQAFEVLSNDSARARYDETLAAQSAPHSTTASAAFPLPPPPSSAPMPPYLYRAAGEAPSRSSLLTRLTVVTGWMSVWLKLLLTLVGSLLLIWLLVQVTYIFRMSRQAAYGTEVETGASLSAREKVIIQDYYQETGVRAASATEVELLRAEDRRKEQLRRAKEEEERKKRAQELAYQRSIEEARRLGASVSENLRYAEEAARRAEEARKAKLEQEELLKREQERAREAARIEAERNKWRSIFLRGSNDTTK